MDEHDRTRFTDAYTQILLSAWSSESYHRLLHTDPVAAIGEFGLQVGPGAEIAVVTEIPADHGEPDLDVAILAWMAGRATGRYLLYVPSTPQLRSEALSDDDLAGVVAGFQVSQCCCTPCCCCS